ncbi:MAG: hypothetical protein AB7J13_12790 [Pyrinomonadaceae bacterium]
MFCPKCGKADQSPETYCRQCGIFLPDLDKAVKKPIPPQQHVTANIVLSSMTIVVSFALAMLLYTILGFRPGTHPLIYITGGLLIAMGFWHVQTLWRAILLRKHFKKSERSQDAIQTSAATTANLLEEADFENIVPASVTDRTTKHLAEKGTRSS